MRSILFAMAVAAIATISTGCTMSCKFSGPCRTITQTCSVDQECHPNCTGCSASDCCARTGMRLFRNRAACGGNCGTPDCGCAQTPTPTPMTSATCNDGCNNNRGRILGTGILRNRTAACAGDCGGNCGSPSCPETCDDGCNTGRGLLGSGLLRNRTACNGNCGGDCGSDACQGQSRRGMMFGAGLFRNRSACDGNCGGNCGSDACNSGANGLLGGGMLGGGPATARLGDRRGMMGCGQLGCGQGGRLCAGCLGRGRGGFGAGHPYGGQVPHTPAPSYGGMGGAPATPTYSYPYYTTRGPRDFLNGNPPSIGR